MEVVSILFGSFAILLLIGAPITIALGVSSMISLFYLGNDLVYLVQVAYSSVDSFPIMALPAFILAGALMEYSGISRRLVKVAEALAGPATGGLASATILACLFFGAISGSGPATTAAVGMLMIPAMMNRGYDKGVCRSDHGILRRVRRGYPAEHPHGDLWRFRKPVHIQTFHSRLYSRPAYRGRPGGCKLLPLP